MPFSASHNADLSIESKAAFRSMNATWSGLLISLCSLDRSLTARIPSRVDVDSVKAD